eukprot:m.204638 g.204638  ORF g.204638 m.204638 type:complete len:443 (-) comp17748_c0_seq3:1949-3277(-)
MGWLFCCPKVEMTWKLPSSLPCEVPLKHTFEEEFGLRPTSPGAKTNPEQSATGRCMQISMSALLILATGLAAIVLCREYLGSFMGWLGRLPGVQGPILFGSLFIPISFPMAWGYLILNLGAGYLYGLVGGVVVTSVGAAAGSYIAFLVCRLLWKDWVMSILSSYENLKQIVRVIEGRQGFRIIMMTRLTPVPFGLQNGLFSIAKISSKRYMSATVLGLLPTQILNTYMGTTLRSMEDVMAGKNNNTFVLITQVGIAIAVTYFVNQRMKREVTLACESEQKLVRDAAIAQLDELARRSSSPTKQRSSSPGRVHRTLSVQDFSHSPITALDAPDDLREVFVDETGAIPHTDYIAAAAASSAPIVTVAASAVASSHSSRTSSPERRPLLDSRASEPVVFHAGELQDMPATTGGEFVRGHRRSHSAGPEIIRDQTIIKLGLGRAAE